ncbi:MAG: response regulator transcription factor [Desulfohalobiaceae bacterium]|nr:response regulator transcription factor [Desulfohalobiaceae bacterium]MCF8085849.1 response regulator transcription factor [Desulfohalobiaceae bacterium]
MKILLADDHSIVLDGLRRIIEDCEDMEVMAEAPDGARALEAALREKPDLAVIDISMPDIDGLELITRLLSHYPELPIVVLTVHEDRQYMFRAVQAGAMGYITKRSASEQLVQAIRKVQAGKRFFPEEVAEALALQLSRRGSEQDLPGLLSMRELQVLKRLALGSTNQEIAESYNISVKTVDTHRQRILKKLGLRNNAEISRFAYQHRIIE